MAANRTGTAKLLTAAVVAIAGALGPGLLAACTAGTGAAPELPPVSPEELISSVLAAPDPGPFAGTVEVVNALGLPALPQLPQAADGTTTVRVWSGGDDRRRVAIPSRSGERTLVADGTTLWVWDSVDRTVVRRPIDGGRSPHAAADPTAAATEALARLHPTSTVTVDGTAEVAGRPAYELVLAPVPTERTLLREVRIAVDAEKRKPLRLTVLAVGSTDPALQIGFTELQFGDQDPELFTFTPPPGATVEEAPPRDAPGADSDPADATTVGDGWDTVVVAQRDEEAEARAPELAVLGTPVSGPWGSGRMISTAVATAIVTDDGRVAAGAVPEQVLAEALAG